MDQAMRKYVGLFFVAIGWVCLTPCLTPAQVAESKVSDSTDWPTIFGPRGDGKSVETGILKDWTGGKLKVLWTAEAGQGYAMGSVAAGKFYHFGQADSKAILKCLDASTGKQVWDFAYDSQYKDLYGFDSGPRASPVVSDGRVYIHGVQGKLHCLDAKTGALIWKVDTLERFGVIQNFFGVGSTPVIFEDLIIVMVGGSPDESKAAPPGALDQVKPNGTGVVAFDRKTGAVRYQAVNDLASYSSPKVATIGGREMLLAWMRGALYGLDPRTGEEIFQFPWRAKKLESVNASTPVVADDQVLISECYALGAVLLKLNPKPEVVWTDQGKRKKSLATHWSTPVLVGDYLYGCSGESPATAELRCVDWKTGEVQWAKRGLQRSSVTYIDGHLVVLGERGRLVLVKADPKQYQQVTEYDPGQAQGGVELKYPCWSAPVISNGRLFVRGKREVVCFELIPQGK